MLGVTGCVCVRKQELSQRAAAAAARARQLTTMGDVTSVATEATPRDVTEQGALMATQGDSSGCRVLGEMLHGGACGRVMWDAMREMGIAKHAVRGGAGDEGDRIV